MNKLKVIFNDDDKLNINSNTNQIEVSHNTNQVKVHFNKLDTIDIDTNTPSLKIKSDERYLINVNSNNHNELNNLDFENSGHIGFASSKELNVLKQTTVPTNLSILPKLSKNANRNYANVYVDNNGVGSRISVKELLSTLLRTSDKIPDDLQNGEYIFLEKGDNSNGK